MHKTAPLLVLFAIAACDKGADGPASPDTAAGDGGATEPAPAPAPDPLTLEQRIAFHDGCFADWVKEEPTFIERCNAAETSEEMVDGGEPPGVGLEAIRARTEGFWKAFTLAGEPVVTLGHGEKTATIYAITLVHDGQFQDMAPTNKKVGMHVVETGSLLADGRHGATKIYLDQGTMMAQLGASKAKARPPIELSGQPRAYALGTDTEAEKANVELVKAAFAAVSAHDVAAAAALYAPEAVLSNQAAPVDITGSKKITAFLKELTKAFPDLSVKIDDVWGAGDWVYAEATSAGTNQAAFKTMGIKKKTGKPFTLHEAHVLRFEEGKVQEHWIFANGAALAGQLGLLPPPPKTEAAPGPEPAPAPAAPAPEKAG
jgi:ketosteroid isomerase-like protein